MIINDSVITDKLILEAHVEEHFKSLFKNKVILQDISLVQNLIPKMVYDNMILLLTRMPFAAEIHSVVKSLNSDSPPGPDGLGLYFSNIIGP